MISILIMAGDEIELVYLFWDLGKYKGNYGVCSNICFPELDTHIKDLLCLEEILIFLGQSMSKAIICLVGIFPRSQIKIKSCFG